MNKRDLSMEIQMLGAHAKVQSIQSELTVLYEMFGTNIFPDGAPVIRTVLSQGQPKTGKQGKAKQWIERAEARHAAATNGKGKAKPGTIPLKEAAERLGISEARVRQIVEEGKLAYSRSGPAKRMVVKEADVDKLREERANAHS